MTTTHSHRRTASLIDEYARTFDVTDTLVVAVDAEPDSLVEALDRIDPSSSVARTLNALGVGDRIALAPALLAEEPGRELVFGLVWRTEGPAETFDSSDLRALDAAGHVKVIWNVRVRPGALGGAFLSTTTRFAATDEATRECLLDGWGTVATLSKSLSQRTTAAIKAYAEDCDELASAVGSTSASALQLAA